MKVSSCGYSPKSNLYKSANFQKYFINVRRKKKSTDFIENSPNPNFFFFNNLRKFTSFESCKSILSMKRGSTDFSKLGKKKNTQLENGVFLFLFSRWQQVATISFKRTCNGSYSWNSQRKINIDQWTMGKQRLDTFKRDTPCAVPFTFQCRLHNIDVFETDVDQSTAGDCR